MSLVERIKNGLKGFKEWLMKDLLVLTGRMASWHVRSQKILSSLQDAEFKVTSQWGEDGIIDWLIERARIPPKSRSFIEFGIGTYQEANTRFLLQNRTGVALSWMVT